jgi:hypothetical protein
MVTCKTYGSNYKFEPARRRKGGAFMFLPIIPKCFLLYSTDSQFVIYSSSARTNRVCPCHLIINLKFTFYEHLEYRYYGTEDASLSGE